MARKIDINLLKEIKKEASNCELFEGREKADFDDYVNQQLTIEDYYPIDDYHVIVFAEVPEKFFFTGGALKKIVSKFGEQDIRGLVVEPLAMIKTASKRDFRPFNVVS